MFAFMPIDLYFYTQDEQWENQNFEDDKSYLYQILYVFLLENFYTIFQI